MLRSNCKSLMNHVLSPGEEKERLQWEGFAGKEGFVDYRVVCILPYRETTTPCSFPPLCFRGASNNDPAHTPHTILAQLSLAFLRGRLIEYQLRLG